MTKTTADVFAFLDEETSLTIPHVKSAKHPEGRDYVIPAPSAADGLRMQSLADIAVRLKNGQEVSDAEKARLQLDDDDERGFAEMVLGSAYHEMIDDDVPWPRLKACMQFAYLWFTAGPEQAEKAAREGQLSGKARPANRSTRRSKKK